MVREVRHGKGGSNVSSTRETLSLVKISINKPSTDCSCVTYPSLEIFNKLAFNFLSH